MRAMILLSAAFFLVIACQPDSPDPPPDPPPETPPETPVRPEPEQAGLPDAVRDPSVRPEARLFLPPLPGHATDDAAEPGEMASSLDHGEVPYAEVLRRVVLDEGGFSRGAVTVVTFEPGSDATERYLRHRFGHARRTPVQVAGVEMLRIAAVPHPVIAWPDPTFAVTFERSSEVDAAWLEALARQTVAAMRSR